MTGLATKFTSDLSENPVLLYMLNGQPVGTVSTPSVDEYIDTVWPTELFPINERGKKTYGLTSYIMSGFYDEERQKEDEWIKLVGHDFYSLPDEKRRFLLQTAGVVKLEQPVDIKQVYNTSIY